MIQLDFFNTTHLYGDQLRREIENAKGQEDKIMVFFRNYPGKEFSPDYVHRTVFSDNVPLTSVRRAITNLTRKGLLKKTENQCIGAYSKLNYTWKLNEN